MKKRSLSAIIILLLGTVLYAQDTITIYYDKDWKEIKDKENASFYRKAYQDKNKVWVANDYYISGKIQMTGAYKTKKMEVKQGIFAYYYENGQKISEGLYVNNKCEKEWIYWYESGQIKSQGKCINDKLEGEWSYWFENGKKKSGGNWLNDQRNGEWDFWDDKGHLEDKEYYRNGLIYQADGFHENGVKHYSGKFVNGKRSGIWTFYNPDGEITMKGEYKNGMREGEWIRYFPDSKMTVKYKNGVIQEKKFGGVIIKEE